MSTLRDLPIIGKPYSHDAALAHYYRSWDIYDYPWLVSASEAEDFQRQADYRPASTHRTSRSQRTIGRQVLWAVILSQLLHASYLAPLLPGLKAQIENPNPFLAAVASQQHASGQSHKDTQAAAATNEADHFKWDTWTGLYGKSQAPWRGAPRQEDMGWGYWVAQDIGAEEWWSVAKSEEKGA